MVNISYATCQSCYEPLASLLMREAETSANANLTLFSQVTSSWNRTTTYRVIQSPSKTKHSTHNV